MSLGGLVPGYWMNEATGVLAPVVRKYLEGGTLTGGEVATMRAYLRQWVYAKGFDGPEIEPLRASIDRVETDAELRGWLADALNAGVDPL